MTDQSKEHGEGNYKASRDYNQRTKQFVESGQVESAAENAAPRDQAEAEEMREAEAIGKSHMKEEDPALRRKQRPAGQP